MLTIARTVEEAAAARGEIRAGGTDVQERRRSGISAGPLVDVSRIPGLSAITWGDDGAAAIGALVSIDAVARDERVREGYPGLAQAAGGLATPQIRTLGTMGGALLQRVRCWYFRHPAFDCYKKGGESCPAREGHNPNGVLFDLGPCVYPHPSTLGMALLAYEAQVEVGGRELRPAAALYDSADPTRDHTLAPGELLTRILLPPPVAGERAAYTRAIGRAEAEWPLVEAIALLVVEDGQIRRARVAVGGVANIPLRLQAVEAALMGRPASAETLAAAAARTAEGATPLRETGYKARLLPATVLEVLERAAGI